MDKAAIYARVSTEEQVQNGISLDAQVHRCLEYASAHNYQVIDTAVDAGLSGKTIERAALQRILSLVNRKKIQHLVTLKLDRLSRSTLDVLSLMDALSKKGVQLHLVAENGSVSSENADDEFLLTLKAGLAQLERKKIAERTKCALDRKRQLGQRISLHAPYGYTFEGSTVVKNPWEQSTIAIIHELHSQGYSIRAIIDKLTGQNLFNRQNRPFSIPSVHRILKKTEHPKT